MRIELVEKVPEPVCLLCLAPRKTMLKITPENRTDSYWICLLCAMEIENAMKENQK